MSQRTNAVIPVSTLAYTGRLAPFGEGVSTAGGDDTLLPLIQRWILALILKYNKADRLAEDSDLRRLFKVGNPDYWHGREDDPITYDDDQERGYEAEMRRKKRWTAELLAAATANVGSKVPEFSHPMFENVRALGGLLNLTETDMVILCVLILLDGNEQFHDNSGRMRLRLGSEKECVALMACLTGCHTADLQLAFRRHGNLRSTGILKLAKDAQDLEDYLELPRGLAALMLDQHESIEPLVGHFFTPRKPSSLNQTHFAHLDDEVSIISGILGESMRQGLHGTNILLYGPPGVGKTELASVIAQALQAELYEVGYSDDEGAPIRGIERLQAFNLCQRLLSRRNNALVLFDEVEDMLERGEVPGKAWVNRALEENPVPSIWITNDVSMLDPAYRRRFDYSVHLTTPPRAVRREIACHHLQSVVSINALVADIANHSDDNSWLDDLAECANLTPAQMQRAAKVARLVETETLEQGNAAPAQKRVLQVLERSAKLLNQPKPRVSRTMATAYDLAYLNTDVPIAQLVESLGMAPGGSMCFYGPPGAGKTALARYIAHALELPVVLRRGSDLLSMYVGGTEHNIAEMFSAAAVEPSVLILDEADSFLQSRSEARHSWEITQVNELLTQMEEYEGLFICTTNLLEKLDPASLRRFDWKIAFHAMTASQRWAFFLQELHLLGGSIEAAQPLEALVRQQLGGLTPGDFAPVTRQLRLLQTVPTAQELFRRLLHELQFKQGGAVEPVRHFSAYDGGQSNKTAQLAA